MRNQHPASFDAQILSRLSNMLRSVRRAQLMAVALAGVWLILATGLSAWAVSRVDYINTDRGDDLDRLGELV